MVSVNTNTNTTVPNEFRNNETRVGADGRCYVKIEGIDVPVEKSDTVYDIMRKYEAAKAQQERKKSNQSRLDYCYKKTFECSKLFDLAMDAWKKARQAFSKFLSEHKVKSVDSLSGNNRKKGEELDTAKNDAHKQEQKYLSETNFYAHQTSSAASAVINDNNMEFLNRA